MKFSSKTENKINFERVVRTPWTLLATSLIYSVVRFMSLHNAIKQTNKMWRNSRFHYDKYWWIYKHNYCLYLFSDAWTQPIWNYFLSNYRIIYETSIMVFAFSIMFTPNSFIFLVSVINRGDHNFASVYRRCHLLAATTENVYIRWLIPSTDIKLVPITSKSVVWDYSDAEYEVHYVQFIDWIEKVRLKWKSDCTKWNLTLLSKSAFSQVVCGRSPLN